VLERPEVEVVEEVKEVEAELLQALAELTSLPSPEL
jgi:hypothetical protein